MLNFQDKRVLVTGGARGIGAAAILYLASDEARSTTGAALVVDGGGTAGF